MSSNEFTRKARNVLSKVQIHSAIQRYNSDSKLFETQEKNPNDPKGLTNQTKEQINN